MSSKKIPLYLKIIIGLILIIVSIIIISSIIVNKQMNAEEIDFGSDIVPTINAIIGKREAINFSSKKERTGEVIKILTYKVDIEDKTAIKTIEIINYIDKLKKKGYTVNKEFAVTSPTAKLSKPSKDTNFIIVIEIEYDIDKSEATFKYSKAIPTTN